MQGSDSDVEDEQQDENIDQAGTGVENPASQDTVKQNSQQDAKWKGEYSNQLNVIRVLIKGRRRVRVNTIYVVQTGCYRCPGYEPTANQSEIVVNRFLDELK